MTGDAAEALRQAGLALSTSGTTTALQAWQLLKEFGLDDEQQQLEEEITAEVAAALEKAEGEAGDRVKYKAAVKQMTNRWELFRLVHGIGAETEPPWRLKTPGARANGTLPRKYSVRLAAS